MSAEIIDGRAIADEKLAELKIQIAALQTGHGITPGLAVILVGARPDSQSYVTAKTRKADSLGIYSRQIDFPETVTQQQLLAKIAELNGNQNIHGILVQMPLPKHIDTETIMAAIDPAKDVDGFHDLNVGKLHKGKKDGFIPCTPKGCMMLLHRVLPEMRGKTAVVIGRSNIVGKPMAYLLQEANATVTLAHSGTHNLPALCALHDIVVAAIGQPEYVKADFIKPGAIVIDIGINRIERDGKPKLVGDVDFAAVREKAAFITPVPGGVGPMTIWGLMDNTYKAACLINNIPRAR
jgi:methylenetetrahydrofolate dehydrogenase (NADP+) / methenyltetrahydrofolate cyclohydrolase